MNAHIMLANLGSDAFVLNVDLDEYLVTDNRTTLPELIDGCFRNQTTRLPRCGSLLQQPGGDAGRGPARQPGRS